jgi:hypothetical protein
MTVAGGIMKRTLVVFVLLATATAFTGQQEPGHVGC